MPTVALLTASRYGPYWVLTFELATAPLVVLVDKLSILPDRHGDSTPLAAPTAPVDGGCPATPETPIQAGSASCTGLTCASTRSSAG